MLEAKLELSTKRTHSNSGYRIRRKCTAVSGQVSVAIEQIRSSGYSFLSIKTNDKDVTVIRYKDSSNEINELVINP